MVRDYLLVPKEDAVILEGVAVRGVTALANGCSNSLFCGLAILMEWITKPMKMAGDVVRDLYIEFTHYGAIGAKNYFCKVFRVCKGGLPGFLLGWKEVLEINKSPTLTTFL